MRQMSQLTIPKGYCPALNIRETEIAIKAIKDFFERELAVQLNLTRISAPLFVDRDSGLNDNLNGIERPVSFDIREEPGKIYEVVHSLAKWKRMALGRYGFAAGEGLYTDMNAIRRDEETDNLHSLYVDQWDWEQVITKEDRTLEFLYATVRKIYEVFKKTEVFVRTRYPYVETLLPEEISFVTTQELEDLYPELDPSDRESAYVKGKGAAFVSRIGGALRSGKKHDGRAPDYDDWQINGDIIFDYPLMNRAIELSSMGVRVDEASLNAQLSLAGCPERAALPFQKALLNGELPLTIGGGIGQSRLCMYFLRKIHVGEVQTSVWPQEMLEDCEKNGIPLL